MSAQAIESVLTRIMNDVTFADMLFANPDATLAGFDLTAEEIAVIKGMARTEFERITPETLLSMVKTIQPRSME